MHENPLLDQKDTEDVYSCTAAEGGLAAQINIRIMEATGKAAAQAVSKPVS